MPYSIIRWIELNSRIPCHITKETIDKMRNANDTTIIERLILGLSRKIKKYTAESDKNSTKVCRW